MTRRTWIGSLAAAGTLWGQARIHAGCQTNAWRIAGFDGLIDVLHKLKQYGYEGYETSFRNLQTGATRQGLEQTGLRFFGVHIFLESYDPATRIPPRGFIAEIAKSGAALGAERLIVSGHPCPDDDALAIKAKGLSDAARISKDHGLQFAYHNHSPEFAANGKEITTLMDRTGGDVMFLLDAGHAYLSGADVAKFFAVRHARIAAIHLRDFRDRNQVILGQGVFDLQPLAAAIASARWSGWLLNEEERLSNEKPGDSAVEPARRHLKKVFGV